jgi:glycosyltransferase involved in cell wall biosynthesis
MAASSPNPLSGDGVRILLLSPFIFYPPRHGTGARIYHLVRALQARHAVTVVYFDRPERLCSSIPLEGLDTIGLPLAEHKPTRWIRWGSRFGLLRATPVSSTNLATLREVIASRSIDVVVCQDLVLAPLLPVLTSRPLVWATEGIFSDLRRPDSRPRRNPYRRLQDWLEYLKWQRLEDWVWSQADALVAVSESEAEALRQRTDGRTPVVVAPNAIEVEAFASVPREPQSPPRVLFVGSGWQPNIEALDFFASKILPLARAERRDLVLSIAGSVGRNRALRLPTGDGVELLGFVDDLRPHYARATCFAAPILSGHGTRMKIIEAMAAGVPVVSTSKGAEGLELRAGEEILIADAPRDFAAMILELIRDPVAATRVGAAGRERVRRDYGIDHAARRLEAALDSATGRSSTSTVVGAEREHGTATS